MRGVVAKRIRKKAARLWKEACELHPHLAKTSGKLRTINIVKYLKNKKTVFQTGTIVVLGQKRVLKNLKWQRKNGFSGPKSDQLALDNAIQWSNAK